MDKNNIQEEVTITPIIRDVERLINKILNLIIGLFKSIFKGAYLFVLFFLKNKFIYVGAIILGATIGYLSTQLVPRQYKSYLILDIKINAKNQLFSDINYLNALVQRGQLEKLSKILTIPEEEAERLTEFRIDPLYSYVRSISLLNSFYRNLDTAVYKSLDKELLLTQKGSEGLSDRFIIQVFSRSEDIFADLEAPILRFLERLPELQLEREEAIKHLKFQKKIYEEEIVKLDSLSNVMNKVLVQRAQSNVRPETSINFGQFGQVQEVSSFNPLSIYKQKIEYAKQIVGLDKQLKYFNACYHINTHFSNYGIKSGPGRLSRSLIGALIVFSLVALSILLKSLKKE